MPTQLNEFNAMSGGLPMSDGGGDLSALSMQQQCTGLSMYSDDCQKWLALQSQIPTNDTTTKAKKKVSPIWLILLLLIVLALIWYFFIR